MRIPLATLALVTLALLVSACGEPDEEATAQTPYAQSPYAQDPSAQDPGAQSPYASGPGAAAAGLGAEREKAVAEALAKGRDLLLSVQQETGAFGDPETGMPPNVGYTAMAVGALVGATPRADVAGDAAIQKTLQWLASQQQENGAIFDNPAFVNYMTSAAVGAFAAAKVPAFRNVQAKAMDYVAGSQIAAAESDASYGGFPYKQEQGQPADLSNLQFALTALADAGLPKDHPVWQRSLVFLSRVQNRSESNDFVAEIELEGEKAKVVAGDDGGAVYYPGNSKLDLVKRSDGAYEAPSYGSMTYALLKCFLLAGVDVRDPRVVAALGWITQNFAIDRNPGFEGSPDPEKAGQQGWYYYVYTLARTLAEYERITEKPLVVKDARGREHNWRAELADAILKRRRADGWWVNEAAERWDEGAPVLATAYAMQALAELGGRFR